MLGVKSYERTLIPLMILIITPALDGLKREWREAAAAETESVAATDAVRAPL